MSTAIMTTDKTRRAAGPHATRVDEPPRLGDYCKRPVSSIVSNYATLIREKKIIFVPTCIIIETMATMHGHIMRLPVSGRVTDGHLAVIVLLLARFTNDLQSTVDAYETGKVKMFMGDWKLDRVKAYRIFASMAERLDDICNRCFDRYRPRLRAMIRDVKREWMRLYRMLDMKSGTAERREGDTMVRYFHCNDTKSWRRTMGSIILSMAEAFERDLRADVDLYLLLLCYTRLKTSLLTQIEELQQRQVSRIKFDEAKILCVSDQEIRISCPICVKFTDEIAKGGSDNRCDLCETRRIEQPF